MNLNLYAGYETFGESDECFVGIMAVANTNADVKLYDPKNCFFTHYLTGKYRTMNYGWIDIQNRVLIFDGTRTHRLRAFPTALPRLPRGKQGCGLRIRGGGAPFPFWGPESCGCRG